MIDDPLKRPLVFGDRDQIEALRVRALAQEFQGLVDCKECEGERVCGHCMQECPACDGTGKEAKLYDEFMRLNGLTGFQMREILSKARK